jgi:hypothetical protein
VTETPTRCTLSATTRVYGRPPVDGTDKEIEVWASALVDVVLGPLREAPKSGR